ncbi:MAG: preprotein translocase subunit SecG [Candidatus Eremiobacteraeota bacterium]|nr:preprotein translocase subunit SecG [Candidatus Eremiobacteraeota bacterium]
MFTQLLALASPAVQSHAVRTGAGAIPTPVSGAVPLQAPVLAPTPAPLLQQTWFQMHAGWLTHSLAVLAFLSCVALVALLAVQTTKQEGLSGTIGGQVQSAYGRPGAEEQLKRITGVVATMFVVLFVILSLTGI